MNAARPYPGKIGPRDGRTDRARNNRAGTPLAAGVSTAALSAPEPQLFSGTRRLPTLGLLLVTTLIAFEAMAVAAVMPTTARALHGLGLYSFGFTAFLVASIVGMVQAGARADRRGAAAVLLPGLAAFATGLLASGLAPDMPVFIAGRAVSGFGAGSVIVAMYVLIARVYDPELRPKIFAAMSGAWVVPALLGPPVAGAVAEHVGWRWVYLGMPPFIALGLVLLAPALRGLPPAPASARRASALAAVLLAAGVAVVQWAAARVTVPRLALAAASLVLLGLPLRRLLPAGTLVLRRGLPAAVASRGLAAGAFFGAEAFLPFTLVTVHGARPILAGLPLTFGAVGWAVGSILQGRAPEAHRDRLLQLGFLLIGVGVAGIGLATSSAVPLWTVVPPWMIAGIGMGLAMPAVSVIMLALSADAEQGSNSAALQISDAVGSASAIALAGAVVTAARVGGHPALGLLVVDLGLGAAALFGVAVARRTRV
jgi:MFS family permease